MFPGRGNRALTHPVSSAWAGCLHCLPAPSFRAWCLSVVPMSPPALPEAFSWEVTVGAGRRAAWWGRDGPQFFSCSSQPWGHSGLPKPAPQCGTWCRCSDFRAVFSQASLWVTAREPTSAENCPLSMVLTASLPAATAAAKRCDLHSDAVHSQEKKEKALRAAASMRRGRLVRAREQIDFFPVKEAASRGPSRSQQGREQAWGGGGGGQEPWEATGESRAAAWTASGQAVPASALSSGRPLLWAAH